MTEVESYVRERVAATGQPCLIAPPECEPSLLAVPFWELFAEEEVGVYVLLAGTSVPDSNDEKWAAAMRDAFDSIKRWVPASPEEVLYRYEEGAIDMIVRVEATALGLSLLQLVLNRAGSRLVIRVFP